MLYIHHKIVIKYDCFNNINSSSLRAWSIYFFEPSLLSFSHSVVSVSLQPQAARQASLSFTISQSLLKFIEFESLMLSNHLILCCPLLLPSIFSNIRVFSRVGSLNQVVKVLELQHQPFQWIFRVDFQLGMTGLISLQSKGLSRVFSSTTISLY